MRGYFAHLKCSYSVSFLRARLRKTPLTMKCARVASKLSKVSVSLGICKQNAILNQHLVGVRIDG